jgi:hypothetical protein
MLESSSSQGFYKDKIVLENDAMLITLVIDFSEKLTFSIFRTFREECFLNSFWTSLNVEAASSCRNSATNYLSKRCHIRGSIKVRCSCASN